jgi:hypothetical protein
MVEICPPVTVYAIFMSAMILFDLYLGHGRAAMRDTAYGVLGGILLFILCAAGMGFAAWGLVILPVVFALFVLALILFDRSFLSVTHSYNGRIPGSGILPGMCGNGECGSSSSDSSESCESDCDDSA